MPRISVSQLTTYRWSFVEDVHFRQQLGANAISIWRRKLDDFGIARSREILTESELAVTSLSYAGGLTGSDGRTLADCLADSRRALACAARIDAGCLILFAGGRNHHTTTHVRRLLMSALDELVGDAELLQVPLAIKPVHPKCAAEWSFLTSLDECLRIVQQYASPWLTIALDTYHFPDISRWDVSAEELAPHLGIVQLGDACTPHGVDAARCPLGSGTIPFLQLADRLVDAGYRGDFDVELMGPDIESANYVELLHQSHAAVCELAALPQAAS